MYPKREFLPRDRAPHIQHSQHPRSDWTTPALKTPNLHLSITQYSNLCIPLRLCACGTTVTRNLGRDAAYLAPSCIRGNATTCHWLCGKVGHNQFSDFHLVVQRGEYNPRLQHAGSITLRRSQGGRPQNSNDGLAEA